MFTGIVEEIGYVADAHDGFLRVHATATTEGTKPGDSIAINGVDLTVAVMTEASLSFHAMPETYRCSNLGELRPGDMVNLERSVRPTDRLSGHIVRGVVEGVGTVASLEPEKDAVIVTYMAPQELLQWMVVKGPICVDGVSLTVIRKTADTFSVSLVEYTRTHTTHFQKRCGARVNLETDLLARYVGAVLEARTSQTSSNLRAEGSTRD